MQKNVCKCNVENEGLRRDQKYMQEYISFSCSRFLVHDAIAYTRVSKNCSVNRKNRQLCHSMVNVQVASDLQIFLGPLGTREIESKG